MDLDCTDTVEGLVRGGNWEFQPGKPGKGSYIGENELVSIIVDRPGPLPIISDRSRQIGDLAPAGFTNHIYGIDSEGSPDFVVEVNFPSFMVSWMGSWISLDVEWTESFSQPGVLRSQGWVWKIDVSQLLDQSSLTGQRLDIQDYRAIGRQLILGVLRGLKFTIRVNASIDPDLLGNLTKVGFALITRAIAFQHRFAALQSIRELGTEDICGQDDPDWEKLELSP